MMSLGLGLDDLCLGLIIGNFILLEILIIELFYN
jgi:hypothetical protein